MVFGFGCCRLSVGGSHQEVSGDNRKAGCRFLFVLLLPQTDFSPNAP